jgi:hypothetical protein
VKLLVGRSTRAIELWDLGPAVAPLVCRPAAQVMRAANKV